MLTQNAGPLSLVCWTADNTLRRGKTNFFEKRVGDYQKAGVMAGLGADARGHEISFTEDF